MAGEYTGAVMRDGVPRLRRPLPAGDLLPEASPPSSDKPDQGRDCRRCEGKVHAAPAVVLHRLPGTADLRRHEAGRARTRASITSACDIGCHLFSILPPFNIGATTMGYGLGGAGAAAFNAEGRQASDRSDRAMEASGTTALYPRIGNAVFNKSDNVHDHRRQRLHGRDRRAGHALVDCRQQDPRDPQLRSSEAVRGVGVNWVRTDHAHL